LLLYLFVLVDRLVEAVHRTQTQTRKSPNENIIVKVDIIRRKLKNPNVIVIIHKHNLEQNSQTTMFSFYSCILFALFVHFCFSTQIIRVPLTGHNWTITDHQFYSTSGYIPGTIHTILFAAHQISEPYWKYNDVNLRHLVYSSWTFSKQFVLTDDFLARTQFTLDLTQIDTIANVTLNGCLLGQTTSMFLPFRFHIDRSCLHVNNQLRIDFQSPIVYAHDQAQAYNVSIPPDCPPDVYLQGTDRVHRTIELASVNVAAYNINSNQWQVDILLESDRQEPDSLELTFVLENTLFNCTVNQTWTANLSMSLLIPDQHIELWWPNGYGKQQLYNLSVYHQQEHIGTRSIGFRIVKLIQKDYGSTINGTSFYFLVNYRPIFIKGSNWIPSDAFQERIHRDKLERLLRSVQLVNMNMLRVWGGGIYERDTFYELADQLGIMLWHDFMFACSLYG
jgi:beta-mannosidase